MNLERQRPRWPDEQLVEALVPTPPPVASPEPAPLPTLPAPAALLLRMHTETACRRGGALARCA
ncbi:hypothetical protein [Micromonospora sp. NPDC005710]|uniref:hypothetical protein n=1 Tax=Micromonospora sp. NPDC005710 TaxID=3157051 RepID=UPI003401BCCF